MAGSVHPVGRRANFSMKGTPRIRREGPGRNDPCPCGSGRKYKLCCAGEDRLVELQSEFVGAHYRRGLAFESRGREDEAIEAYSIAAASGHAPEAHSRLGHIFTNRGMAKAASEAFRAAGANAATTDRRLDLVRALMVEGKSVEAEAEARRVIELDPESADGFWLLGRVLSETGRFVEARAALEQAVTLEPRLGVAYYDLVRARQIGSEDRPLVERMLRIVPSLTENDQRIRMHLALGKALDDLGEFGQAVGHFEKANQIKKALGSFDRAAFARRIDSLIERFSAHFIAVHARDGDGSELPVMIVGMPRSGTTLVEQILSSHDEVSGGGEMPFWTMCAPLFDKAKDEASVAQFLRRTAQVCLAAMRTVGPGAKRVTDKDPFNFLWAGLIHLTFPRATIIHCRRDSDRHLPVGVLHLLPAASGFLDRSGGPGLLPPPVPTPDRALARRVAAIAIYRG